MLVNEQRSWYLLITVYPDPKLNNVTHSKAAHPFYFDFVPTGFDIEEKAP